MSETFYTLVTTVGLAKLANAQALGTTVNLVTLKAGDSGGAYRNPAQGDTALVGQVWTGNINQITTDSENPNWVIVEAVIPTDVGGFYIREVGLFDDAGDLIAIGKYPETYKPTLAAGSGKDLYIRMILEISNAAQVTLKIDPAIVLASRKYVDDRDIAHHTWVKKSAAYTAKAWDRLAVDTTAAPVTVTLPLTPTAGQQIDFVDAAGTFKTNALTVARNGQKIMGLAEDMTVDKRYVSFGLVFVDATNGWRLA